MYRHSYWLALALFAANVTQAQSVAPENTQEAPAPDLTATAGSGVLPLPVAIDLALTHNKTLAAARREIEAVEASIIQAGARPNPALSALLEDTRKATRTATYQINQTIELGGKRDARIEAAQRSLDMALLAYAARRGEIRAGVTAAYYEAVVALERQRLAQQLSVLAHTATDIAARRVAAGKISPVEQTRAGVAQASARLELKQAESELTLAQRKLAAFWGASGASFQLAGGDIEALPPLPEIERLTGQVAQGPAVRRARLEVERRRALARIESSKRVPDVTFTFGNKRDESSARNMWVVGMSVPIPVLDSNRGNELEALRRVDQARDELAAIELDVQNEAAQGYERLRNARDEAGVLREDIVPAAWSAYQAARTGFELGKFAFLDVLDAQRTYFQSRAQYWKALSAACQAAAELDRLTGVEHPTAQ